MHPRSKNLLPAIMLAGVACAFAFTSQAASDPTTTSTTQPAASTPLTVGPIAYYIDACSRCHGDIGASYVGLEKPKKGKELEQVIDEMAVGPANAPLDAEGLKQQTALHVAMFEKKPFVWIGPTKGGVVTGELLPGTTLTVEGGEAPKITDTTFEVKAAGTLVATREGTAIRVPLSRR